MLAREKGRPTERGVGCSVFRRYRGITVGCSRYHTPSIDSLYKLGKRMANPKSCDFGKLTTRRFRRHHFGTATLFAAKQSSFENQSKGGVSSYATHVTPNKNKGKPISSAAYSIPHHNDLRCVLFFFRSRGDKRSNATCFETRRSLVPPSSVQVLVELNRD